MSNLEKGESKQRYGFPAVARFISHDPDSETYVFRKFSELTARNLVRMQCELMDLERQMKELDRKAEPESSNDPSFVLSSRSWETMKSLAAERDGDERKLMALNEEIEARLENYHAALLQAGEIAKLKQPSNRVMTAYRHEFSKMDIRGDAAAMLDVESDLVALKPPPDGDLLSNMIRNHWPGSIKTRANPDGGGIVHYQEHQLQLLVSLISISIATVLLVGSILLLYFVQEPDSRLGLLIMFIILFAVGIRISTSASRDSIFAATAAYSAVLVVFVSGDLGNAKAASPG
ncbi:unnamed protein product [Zymoseptoria tritici ST99CH_1A5]|uniref:DUF6594 domain-containing protein n=3 Tax=Zymoseptoria tritici TaxID=1047171 RepID=A0A1X7RKR6_ZYMT9|nr:unnamed protein product [Zymoseptoria tritici ST99CH_3D7]SMR46568.1 unnamed protein product [Zymoseptoria tritici ST99CH_1E4]SMR47810.1 unnamed protein product [Zymoseptoria tritici ST99CH_3D1]SMY21717.1 unnamed protein product [Zymoseptoria tritici ST99CH_1A5]